MAKINIQDFRRNRTESLMDRFFSSVITVNTMCDAGYRFKEVLPFQQRAADIMHDLDEEGLLDIAEELYPCERDTMKEYLEIYNEIANGVKV